MSNRVDSHQCRVSHAVNKYNLGCYESRYRKAIGPVTMGNAEDVDKAVAATQTAFNSFHKPRAKNKLNYSEKSSTDIKLVWQNCCYN